MPDEITIHISRADGSHVLHVDVKLSDGIASFEALGSDLEGTSDCLFGKVKVALGRKDFVLYAPSGLTLTTMQNDDGWPCTGTIESVGLANGDNVKAILFDSSLKIVSTTRGFAAIKNFDVLEPRAKIAKMQNCTAENRLDKNFLGSNIVEKPSLECLEAWWCDGVELNICGLSGTLCKIIVARRERWKTRQLKVRLEEKLQIPSSEQRLFMDTEELTNDVDVSSIVDRGARTLSLVRRSALPATCLRRSQRLSRLKKRRLSDC
jgi:hypothetical protein